MQADLTSTLLFTLAAALSVLLAAGVTDVTLTRKFSLGKTAAVWGGFLILFLLTKYVSLGSVWAGASFPFISWYCYPYPVIVLLAFLLGGLVLWKQRSNIVRLVHGNENKFSIHHNRDKS